MKVKHELEVLTAEERLRFLADLTLSVGSYELLL
jgi:hypothetical protein